MAVFQKTSAKRHSLTVAALAITGGLLLTSCSSNASGGNSDEPADGGTGLSEVSLPAGSTKEEYIEAFADVEPIEIITQTPAPKGSATGLNMENYFKKVEEWSGGKITFDVSYSNALAAPAEIDDALVDGRLDLGSVLPIYEPSDYPATNALIEAGILNDGSAVVGVLQSNAWSNQVAFDTPEIMDEWDQAGLVPLVPVFNSGANGLFCSSAHTTLDSLKGATISAGGTIQSAQIESLGASPVSIAYTELYESLQRGVVSCAVSSETVSLLGGYLSEAAHVVIDPAATFSVAPGGLAFSKAKWAELPLIAQQLFWDSLDIFLGENITVKIWPNAAEADETVQSANGSFSEFEPAARQALQAVNEEVLTKIRASSALDGNALVDKAEAASKDWTEKVLELGYPSDVGYAGFAQWWSEGDTNIDSYLELVMDEVFSSHRPE